ncbi:protein trichome birefringence-like 25 [Prosopis cineraria]|uniref:protein trichome birefringence-like 25 n=1 Tax=Prosopis cineraria TaxID=364024 RepID=UPI0024105C90|nr:protein trichome birefringence-like 25 [Prosopis cineraria]
MVKGMRSGSNPFSVHKHNQVLVKLVVSLLLVGLAFRLLVSDSVSSSSLMVMETPTIASQEKAQPPGNSFPLQTHDAANFPANEGQTADNAKCALFVGQWVPNPYGPAYTNESCHVIEDHQNCMKNGRPDMDYLYWRWRPHDCELPKFNPQKFLNLMRDKSWAFIGDSISRNHVQSMLCILSEVEPAVQVCHDEEFKNRVWKFPAHNFTVSAIWAPFLVKADIFEDINGVSSAEAQLYLDVLESKWINRYESFDYVVTSGGKWFLRTAVYLENGAVTGCHYCANKSIKELGFEYAYRKALQVAFNFFINSNHKPVVIFRTTTPDHFENAEWYNGGYCNRTMPFKEGQIGLRDLDIILRSIELREFQKAKVKAEASPGSKHGATSLNLLDLTGLSLLRPDGHPGPYRHFQPFAKDRNARVQNDCLHWCLPGPIDSWNDLVMQIVVNGR